MADRTELERLQNEILRHAADKLETGEEELELLDGETAAIADAIVTSLAIELSAQQEYNYRLVQILLAYKQWKTGNWLKHWEYKANQEDSTLSGDPYFYTWLELFAKLRGTALHYSYRLCVYVFPILERLGYDLIGYVAELNGISYLYTLVTPVSRVVADIENKKLSEEAGVQQLRALFEMARTVKSRAALEEELRRWDLRRRQPSSVLFGTAESSQPVESRPTPPLPTFDGMEAEENNIFDIEPIRNFRVEPNGQVIRVFFEANKIQFEIVVRVLRNAGLIETY